MNRGNRAPAGFVTAKPDREGNPGALYRLGEQVEETLRLLVEAKPCVPGTTKYTVLKCVRAGIIELQHLMDRALFVFAMIDQRARRRGERIAGFEHQMVSVPVAGIKRL